MNTHFISALLFSVITMVSTVFAQSTPTINTPPSIVQCQPSLITWSGGVPPYFLSVSLFSNPSFPIVNLGEQNGTSFTWKANVTAGSSIVLNLRDETGYVAQSAQITVQSSSDSSCINAAAVPSNIGSAATSATAGSSSASGSTPASGTPGTSAPSTTGGSGGSSASAQVSQGASSTSTGAKTAPSSAAAANHFAPVGTLVMTGAGALAFAFLL